MRKVMGRPTKYRVSVARGICLRLMLGQSLNEICKIKGYPSKTTVFTWLQIKPDFLDQYRRAREVQQETHLDALLEIADDATNDWMERNAKGDDEKAWQLNGEHVNRSKLRIDTRKWIMERLAPKVYGSKLGLDHTSSDGSMTPKGKTLDDFYDNVSAKPES